MTFDEWEKDNWMYIDVKENARTIWDAAQAEEHAACVKACESAAGVARPYKLDQQYGFGFVSGEVGTTYGTLVDANTHELVFRVDAGGVARLVIVGRCSITAAVEVEMPNVELTGSALLRSPC